MNVREFCSNILCECRVPSVRKHWVWEHTNTHLGVPVIGLFKLKMFASLAAQVQPLPLQPLQHWLPQKVGRVHLGYKHDVLTCR